MNYVTMYTTSNLLYPFDNYASFLYVCGAQSPLSYMDDSKAGF